MDIKEKIQQYLDYKNININQLETSIGASKSYWRKTKSISANVVCDISRVYSDINLEWLFRETGDMIKVDPLLDIPTSDEDLKAEVIALKAENKVLRELAGLGERKDSNNKSA